MMETLYEKLVKYKEADYYPFHMPGHKRNLSFEKMIKEGSCGQSLRLPFSDNEENFVQNNHTTSFMWNSYGIDITEIDGFDNLHNAEGILADAMERAARVCGAEKTYFLVNGSTCGLLAGISACVKHGDTIIAARNCHKAVYHAIELNELVPRYIYPQKVQNYGICSGISSENLREMLITYPNAKLVVVTSPTYEGVVSDIQALADTAHEFGIPLLVDEAHGAHFGQSDFFPKSALSCGADIVIQSMHKTMPAFTQTALLHLGINTIADRERIEKYLSMYQTSSPSYLFMASIDWCMDFLEKKPEKIFRMYEKRLTDFYERTRKLKELEVFCPIQPDTRKIGRKIFKNELLEQEIYDFDCSKINIFVKEASGITGSQLYDILLKEYHLQMEMVSKDYVLAMTSICDTEEGIERLIKALEEIDWKIEQKIIKGFMEKKKIEQEYPKKEKQVLCKQKNFMKCNPIKMTPYQAQCVQGVSVLFAESKGKIAKEYIYLYPPGIPLLVPGEEMTSELIESIERYRIAGLKICGQKEEGYIVVAESL